ncbi:MAG: copper resistance protein CopC [Caulobacterales bacterium]
MLAPVAAQAHAFLDHASPAVGSTLTTSPVEIRLWFTEAVSPLFSSFSLLDGAGRPVSADRPRLDPADPREFVLALPHALPPGRYQVRWRVVSVDTHVTQGDFRFEIRR